MNKTLFIAVLLITCSVSFAGDGKVIVQSVEQWSNVFGGKEHTFHCSISAGGDFKGSAKWEFTVSGRTISRGEQEVSVSAAAPFVSEMKLAVPPVKDGVVMQGGLKVDVYADGSDRPAGGMEKKIWIFGDDPFDGRKEWLKRLNIQLFDPEKKTAERLTGAGVPFSLIANVDALAQGEGLLLVGEGVSLKDYKGLSGELMRAAAGGRQVTCLALSAGDMILPGMGDVDLPVPVRMTFAGSDIISQLDKRLDAEGWAPDGTTATGSMKLQGARGPVEASIVEGGAGWQWIDMKFGKGGRLIICGFGIVGKWESGPTARYLFAGVLKELDKSGVVENLKREE